ncbi:cadherin EGF LAG seven-pass G-type receptor 1-like [Palaemon carinicauda]|uniref:cadherin EGF LAG seven-pass G-type receptor 1-like n=1 Tax=Palaemon carinicauda TaxID=392227 RepID=UPI0035B691EA
MTDAGGKEDNYATTDGPFGFGYAVSLSSAAEQCMIHESYQVGEENCTRNPKECAYGFSFSVWEKAFVSQDDFAESSSFTESDHKYILSTGGDEAGHPGVALYHKGYWLGAVVSTGDQFWKVEVAGISPNDTWSNIAVRWEQPTPTGEKGLELYVDLKKVGQRVYGSPSSPLAPLDPALVMIGCHKTSTDTNYRGYNDAEYDEIAMWQRRLPDNETNFFFGGFEANFSNVNVEEYSQMINSVDLSDPDQRAYAVDILNKMTHEEPTPSVAPEPTSSSSTSSSSSTAVHSTATSPTASSATDAPPNEEEMARHATLVELIEKFTSNTSIPKRINTKTHEGMMDILESVSNMFLPPTFEKWRELQKERPGSSKVIGDLENWMMGVSKAIVFNNGSEPYKNTRATETILTETYKITSKELETLRDFYEFPEYKLLPGIRKDWNLPYDRSAVPTKLFNDSRCGHRALNIISTLYDTYDDVATTRVNRKTLDKYLEYKLDSRVMSVRAETNPVLNKYRMVDPKAPPCIPTLGKRNPIRLKFEHNVKQYTMRNLKFHDNETVIEINQRICGWFNKEIGEHGAWDRTGCKILITTAEYTKCACEHFGTYAILAEQVEPREVPPEQLWLTITKYIGYILSFIALIIYIAIILVSGDLKDMFHLIGLNLAFAVLFGSIFMLVSDMQTIRDDRHVCAAIGTLIHVFYLGAGAWIFVLGHASFKAITAGVISGRLRAYFFLAWSVPILSMGLTYLLFFHDLGLDPRCFMSWVNEPKYCFFGPQIFFSAVSFIFGCIVICNMSTPALRKDNLIDDYGSFCYGGAFVMIFFAITWTFGLLAYVRFHFRDLDFYPIFQVFNSWTGLIILLFIGFGSKRFRMVLAGQAKARREALFGNAFGTPAVPIEDRQHLGSPVDQRSKSATPSVSGRSSPERSSSAGPNFPNRPPSMGVVAGRPGSRPNSGF